MTKVLWQPQKKQEFALVRDEKEILFGGSRGGGKTDAGIVWLIEPKYIQNERYRGLVIRRNADDLRDWIDRAEYLYNACKANKAGQPPEFIFPSGAKIRTGHLNDAKAYAKYQGHEYQKILIEELTHIPRESDFEKLLGSCRSTIDGLRPQLFATTNPDGDGFDWVKDRWNIPDVPNKPIESQDSRGIRRIFIPSWLSDNEFLQKNDDYKNYLESIKDDTLRKQWLFGSWEEPQIEGSYYAKWISKATDEQRIKLVPYDPILPVHTFWDLGVGDSTSIWFVQLAGMEIRLIDFLEAEGEGLNYYISEIKNKGYAYGEHWAPHDIAVREFSSGKSRKEIAKGLGIDFQIAPNLSIDDGINAVRMILPRCYFDQNKCKEGIRALKNYKKEYDEKRDIFKSRPVHNWASHASDAFRYLAVSISQLEEKKTIKAPKSSWQKMSKYEG
jgi:hypothetical protein